MRNAVARVLLGLATLAGALAFTAYLLLATTLNPHRVGDVAASLLDDPAGRSAVTKAVVGGIERTPGASLSSAPRGQLGRFLTSPDVRRALRRTTFTADGDLDYRPALRAVATRLRAAGQPGLASAVTDAAGHQITVPSGIFDRYVKAHDLAETVLRDGGIAAGVGAVACLLIASDRRWALRRIGWGTLGVVAGALVLYLLLPRLIAAIIGDNIGSALLTALGTDLVGPLVLVAAIGAGVIALSYVPLGSRRP
jgi:hypothetical protein